MASEPQEPDISATQDASETTPLISETTVLLPLSQRRKSPYLIFPVTFAANVANTIVATTLAEVLRQLSCQWWYHFNDPESIPRSGDIPDAMCRTANVEHVYARLFNAYVFCEAFGTLVVLALIGKYASSRSRKPALLLVCLLPILATVAFFGALFIRVEEVQVALLGLWLFLAALAAPSSVGLLSIMYVVDTTEGPAERTTVLTFLKATIMAAMSAGFLGGFVTRWSGSVATVFFISLSLSLLVILYASFFVPESFAVTSEGVGQSSAVNPKSTESGASVHLGSFLHPFRHVIPRRATGSKHNLRLPLLLVIGFLGSAGSSYVAPALVLYATTTFRLDPSETGFMLSMVTLGKVCFMILGLPAILSLRPRFNRFIAERARQRSTRSTSSDGAGESSTPSPSTRFEVFLLGASLVVDSVATAGLGMAQSWLQLTVFLVMFAFGSAADPTLQTLVTASCEKSASGEVLSALQMTTSLAQLVSMAGLGAVLASTISTMPSLVFWISSGLLGFGAALLAFVRDADRWNS